MADKDGEEKLGVGSSTEHTINLANVVLAMNNDTGSSIALNEDETDSPGASHAPNDGTLPPASTTSENEYPEKITVWVGTWNVGNSCPPSSLLGWLPPAAKNHTIIAIGAQECSYTPRSSQFPTCASDWEALLCSHLRRYTVCRSIALGEMRLFVFVRKRYAKWVKHIDAGSCATGIANMLGNKGGLAVSFHFGDLRLGFVSCHLAAHQNQTMRRNLDVRNIVSGIRVGKWAMDLVNQVFLAFLFLIIFTIVILTDSLTIQQ